MDGSTRGAHTTVDIQLERGPSGLGFNIVGGLDQQFVLNDAGIYVSKIKENGAAALDGRLQEGDKILSINGIKLEDRTHSAAVELFRTAGEDVLLRVQKKTADQSALEKIHANIVNLVEHARHQNGPSSPHGGDGPPVSVAVVAVVLGAAALSAFLYLRFRR